MLTTVCFVWVRAMKVVVYLENVVTECLLVVARGPGKMQCSASRSFRGIVEYDCGGGDGVIIITLST